MKTKVGTNRSIRIKKKKEKKISFSASFLSSRSFLMSNMVERMKDQSEIFKTAKSGLKNSRTLTVKSSQMLLKT